MNFRKDINGLRAIAVLVVVLFHFGVPGFTGGFVGVDVFFVISGYLMTGIIFRRLDENSFSLAGFYLDRAKRIVPALCAVSCTVIVIGWFVLFPEEYKTLGKYVAGAITFISNIVFMRDSSYFNSDPHDNWMLHTWSLSVEWQFYLAYPILIMLLRKRLSARFTRLGLIIALNLSFLISLTTSARWPTQSFFLLPTRSWEMLAGGLVFLYPFYGSTRSRVLLECVGLLMITFACLKFDSTTVWPGGWAVVPVAGAALMLVAGRGTSILTGNALAQFLGSASYSIYLWHWPIVVALNYMDKAKDPAWIVSAIFASIIVGHVSMRYIESLGRNNVKAGKREPYSVRSDPVMCKILGTALTVGLLGFGVASLQGVPGNFRSVNTSERTKFIQSYDEMHRHGLTTAYKLECDFYDNDQNTSRKAIDPTCVRRGGPHSVFLWGDSHAQALSLGLRSKVSEDLFSQIATSGCMPSTHPQTSRAKAPIDNRCDHSNESALSEIARVKPETVVLAQRWHHGETDWDALAARLQSVGVKQVLLMGPVPTWTSPLPVLIAKNHWIDKPAYLKDRLDQAVIKADTDLYEKYLNSRHLKYVSIIRSVCGDLGCPTFVPHEKTLTAVDYGHLTPSGSTYFASKIFSDTTLFSMSKAAADKSNLFGQTN